MDRIYNPLAEQKTPQLTHVHGYESGIFAQPDVRKVVSCKSCGSANMHQSKSRIKCYSCNREWRTAGGNWVQVR